MSLELIVRDRASRLDDDIDETKDIPDKRQRVLIVGDARRKENSRRDNDRRKGIQTQNGSTANSV